MAYEEVSNGSMGDREFLNVKIGTEIEGTFRGTPSRLIEGKFGAYRVYSIDLVDGRQAAIRASKILLEKLEAAGLTDGDNVKIVVESATSKAGNTYALPRLYIDRTTVSRTTTAIENPPF